MRFFLTVCLAFLGLLAGVACAHPNLQNAMWVQFEPDKVHLAVNVSAKEISVAQSARLSGGGGEDAAALQRAAERHGDYVLGHLRVSVDGRALRGTVRKLVPPAVTGDAEGTIFQYEIEYPLGGPPPAEVTFFHDMLKEWPYAADTAWDVSYVVRAKRQGSNDLTSWLIRAQQPAVIATGWGVLAPPAAQVASDNGWRTFREYLSAGIWHILTGYDHLLFVSALVIATFSFWEMVKVIAAFTLAHTITLALCVFDIFRLPAFVVEPVIALSIIFVALENVFRPQRAHSWLRLAVAFGFGLIHGLGFAGGLLEAMAGLPAVGTWIALGAFSIGVELGHQAVVLPLFGLLALARHQLRGGTQAAIQRYGSGVISCCGAYYLVVALHQQVFSR